MMHEQTKAMFGVKDRLCKSVATLLDSPCSLPYQQPSPWP